MLHERSGTETRSRFANVEVTPAHIAQDSSMPSRTWSNLGRRRSTLADAGPKFTNFTHELCRTRPHVTRNSAAKTRLRPDVGRIRQDLARTRNRPTLTECRPTLTELSRIGGQESARELTHGGTTSSDVGPKSANFGRSWPGIDRVCKFGPESIALVAQYPQISCNSRLRNDFLERMWTSAGFVAQGMGFDEVRRSHVVRNPILEVRIG